MKTRTEQVRKVCQEWHGGQWSALYQFKTNGIYMPEYHLRYLRELQERREPEYYLNPGTISKKDDKKLESAQRYFINEGKKLSIVTDWESHKVYGYMIPVVFDAPENLFNKIQSLRIPI